MVKLPDSSTFTTSQLTLDGVRIERKWRSRPTKPERALKLILATLEVPYVREPLLPGTPDFLIPKMKMTIFVDGDFWHDRDGRYLEKLKARLEKIGDKPPGPVGTKAWSEWYGKYQKLTEWINKIEGTKRHDLSVTLYLSQKGYDVRRIWESDLMSYVR